MADNVEELEQHYKLMAQDCSFVDVWPRPNIAEAPTLLRSRPRES